MRLHEILKTDLSYNETGKAAFHKEAKRVLRALAKELGLKTGEFEVRSNLAGIAVSGEVTLHADHWYVQVNQAPCPGDVLWRLCRDRKDYTGMANNFASAVDMENVAAFALRLRRALTSPRARGGGYGKPLVLSDEFMQRFAVPE